MNYISLCSGIEAATVAFHPLGWAPLAFCEIENFPSAVLAHHYPGVPNWGDITKYKEWPESVLAECDLVVGGPPCQAFSVAGLRNSLDDERGNLTLVYVHIIDHIDEVRKKHGKPPVIFVYENVPGLLSTKDNAFGCLLAGLAGADSPLLPQCGWLNAGMVSGPERLLSWRVLDAQFFGVPQRRRRIFAVGVSVRHPGARECASAILPVIHSLQGHTPPSRKAGASVAGTFKARASSGGWGQDIELDAGGYMQPVAALTANGVGTCGADDNQGQAGHLIAFGGGNCGGSINVAASLCAHGRRQDFEVETFITHTLRGEGFNASEDGTGRGTPLVAVGYIHPRQCRNSQTSNQVGIKPFAEVADTLTSEVPGAVLQSAVRRLTPEECELLQGFQKGYTLIPVNKKGKMAADGPRYKALGNSMAVPCMEWIGRRIQMVEEIA